MKILFFILFFLSTSTFASVKCITHGQCQTSMPEQGIKCLIVKTGTDVFGNVACRQQCYQLAMTTYCHKENANDLYGECRSEQEPPPYFDPNEPRACDQAVEL